MPGLNCIRFAVSDLAPALAALMASGFALAQNLPAPPGVTSGNAAQVPQQTVDDKYLKVPLVNNIPGGIATEVLTDDEAAEEAEVKARLEKEAEACAEAEKPIDITATAAAGDEPVATEADRN